MTSAAYNTDAAVYPGPSCGVPNKNIGYSKKHG